VVPSGTDTAAGRRDVVTVVSQQHRKIEINTAHSNPEPTAGVTTALLKNAAVGNMEARNLVSAAITALLPANVDFLMQKPPIFSHGV
jgi:hypothetical protein